MKWLILLMFFSCGKNVTPSFLDMQDSDGDLLLNFQEEDMNRYLAEVNFPLVQGSLSFLSGGKSRQKVEIEFSNQTDMEILALHLLAGGSESSNAAHFSESRLLKLKNKTLPQLDDDINYHVEFNFTSNVQRPRGLHLITEKGEIQLSEWSNKQELMLDRKTLLALLQGQAHLAISELTPRLLSIQQNTYRVLIQQESDNRVLYVSHEISLKKLLDYLQISAVRELKQDRLFYLTDDKVPADWVMRQVNSKSIVLMHTQATKVAQAFLQTLRHQTLTVSRINGVPQSSVTITKQQQEKVFIKLRPQLTSRHFVESTKHEQRYSDYQDNYRYSISPCIGSFRHIGGEMEEKPSLNFILEQVEVGNQETLADWMQQEKIVGLEGKLDQKGYFYEIALNVATTALQMKLKELDASSYVITGRYRQTCNANKLPLSHERINYESKFTLNMEVYVEKLK